MRIGEEDNSSLSIDAGLFNEFRDFLAYKQWQKTRED
jgi:hypothetical protein